MSPQYIAIRHRITGMQSGAKVNPKSCNHFEKRSATASDWGGKSEAKTNPTSCNSGLYCFKLNCCSNPDSQQYLVRHQEAMILSISFQLLIFVGPHLSIQLSSLLNKCSMMLDNGNIFSSMGNGTPFQPVSVENTTVNYYIKFADSPLNKTLVAMSSLLSMMGSFIIIASFAAWKDIRTTSRKILLFLSVSDFLTAISNFIGTLVLSDRTNEQDPRNPLCVAQSFVTNSVSISSFLWTQTLAFYLYMAILKNKQALGKKILPYAHVVNWTLGPVINGIALSQRMLGFSAAELTGGWCWIYQNHGQDHNAKRKEYLWLTLDAKAIEFLVYTSVLVIYFRIRMKIHAEVCLLQNMAHIWLPHLSPPPLPRRSF